MALCSKDEVLGFSPIPARWRVVRGDTAKLSIEFFENDEVTVFNTDGWEFESSAFSPITQEFYDLETTFENGVLEVIAQSDVTESWASGMTDSATELRFDVQATMPDGTVWTPIVGTILVVSDITGASL